MFAHSPKIKDHPYQTLTEHLANVGALASTFLYKFHPLWGEILGWTHDLGKASPEWQAYLLAVSRDGRRMKSPGHDFQGAVYNFQHGNLPLAYMVAGHHRGLMDPEPDPKFTDFAFRAELCNPVNVARCAAAEKAYPLPQWPILKLPSWVKTPLNLDVFTRMGFSALIDADRLDTEAYSATSGDYFSGLRKAARGTYPALSEYGAILHKAIDDKSSSSPETPVNRIRARVVADCRMAANCPPGAYTLTVPTGGGKTLSSLEFALLHAEKNGHKRVIIALPYTSIIDQTADVFRSVFSSLGTEVVLEHHSNLTPEKETAATKSAVENWDAPLIITTQVQLFDSLFSNHPRECRKIHRLQDSILILDEVQTLPVHYLTPILSMLQELIDNYGVTVLLTTATQPSLGKTDYFPGLSPVPQEIISSEFMPQLWAGLKRVQTHWPWEWDCPDCKFPDFWDKMALKILAAGDSCLAICHLKKDSRALFEAVRQHDPSVLHLSASMISVHRRKVLAEVKRRLAAHEPCRLISTQVVEAGVDLDFPVVFRAMAGLESLAQSAGRCNREGRLSQLGAFFIFKSPNQPPGALRYNKTTAESMIIGDQPLDLFTPETFPRYFDALYLGKIGALDTKKIQKDRSSLRFLTVARNFRLIPDLTDALIIPYDDKAIDLIKLLDVEGPSYALLRKLQPYTVNVFPQQLETLEMQNKIIIHGGVKKGDKDGIYSLNPNCHNYHPDYGLYVDKDDYFLDILMG